MATTPVRVLRYEEAEALLRVKRSSIQRLIRDGQIKVVFVGGARRILESSVNDYLRRQAGG